MSNDNNFSVTKSNENWSITEKIHDWVRNAEWQEGYNDVAINDGAEYKSRVTTTETKTVLIDGQQVEIEQEVINLNNAYANSNLWAFIYESNEDIGKVVYEKIANIVPNLRDVDTCNVHALYSLAIELGVENPKKYEYNFPVEIQRLVNIFSISKSRLLQGDTINSDDIKALIASISNTNDPYVIFDDNGDIDVDNDGVRHYGFDANSSLWSKEEIDSFFVKGETNPADPSVIEQVTNVVKTGDIDEYLTSLEELLRCVITEFLLTDNGTILNEMSDYDAPDDSDNITDLKEELNVPASFKANLELDLIQEGITDIDSYTYPEKVVLNATIEERSEEQTGLGDKTTRYKYERGRKVRAYINMIEMLNNEKDGVFDNCGYVTDMNDTNFLDLPMDTVEIDGVDTLVLNSAQETFVNSTTAVLRNIILQVMYQREDIKLLTKKYAINGTDNIVKIIIREHLARHFVKPEVWNYNTNGLAGTYLDVDNVKIDSLLGNINIIEYFDNTNYMNIETESDSDTTTVNPRYWESGIFDSTVGNYTRSEVTEFYANIDTDQVLDFNFETILPEVYDMGADKATINHTFNDADGITIEDTGKFGTYGYWKDADTNTHITVHEDVEPMYKLTANINTILWLQSPLLANWTTEDLLTAWANNPNLELWQTDITVHESFATNPESVEWYTLEYPINLWKPNSVTNIWRQSPLVAYMDMVTFRDRWVQTYEEFGASNAIIEGWRKVELLDDPTLGWRNLPEVARYLAVVPAPTQIEWETASDPLVVGSPPFLSYLVHAPFTEEVIGNSFDPAVDWKDNPNVTDFFLEEPFTSELINDYILHTELPLDTSDVNTSKKVILHSFGALEDPDGLSRLSVYTGDELKPMFNHYLGVDGERVVTNNGNTIHPSTAFTPFLQNFTEVVADGIYELIHVPLLRKLRSEQAEIDILHERINEFGATINQWRSDFDKLHGYITQYEESNNHDSSNVINKNVDIDGPWNWKALQWYLESPADFTTTLIDNTNEYYSFLGLATSERTVIANNLTLHYNEIKSLQGQIVYQYATDKYYNHYMLFKTEDVLDTRGRLWVRTDDHPLPLPVLAYTGASIGTDYYDKQYLSQLDNTTDRIVNAESTLNDCCDFDIYNGDQFVVLGGSDKFNNDDVVYVNNEPYTIDGDVYSPVTGTVTRTHTSTDGFVMVFNLKFEDVGGYCKLIGYKDNELAFEGWDIQPSEKFVGFYTHNKNTTLITIEASEYVDDDTYLSFDGSTHNGIVKFSTYLADGTIIVNQIQFTSLYGEYKFDKDNINYHNQWRLANSSDAISIVFESEIIGADGEFCNYLTETEGGYYDPTKNTNAIVGANTFTTIDLIKNTYSGYGESKNEPVVAQHFYQYSKVGFIGINAD
jgi:hypothetical protein